MQKLVWVFVLTVVRPGSPSERLAYTEFEKRHLIVIKNWLKLNVFLKPDILVRRKL